MPRKSRVSANGIPQHVIQRGNNRQVVFTCDIDMAAYINWLKQYAVKFNVAIHTWVLMTNHVHLLCTPSDETGISKMMQCLGRMYVAYFNKTYNRSGTLWEGRFRSCLVQEENYLLHLYRYIELNPVRAGMVDAPGQYHWSGYQCNALGKVSELRTPHPLYQALGKTEHERQYNYQLLFSEVGIKNELLTNIRRATNKGLAIGKQSFIVDIEALTGKRLVEEKRGRKPGTRNRIGDKSV